MYVVAHFNAVYDYDTKSSIGNFHLERVLTLLLDPVRLCCPPRLLFISFLFRWTLAVQDKLLSETSPPS